MNLLKVIKSVFSKEGTPFDRWLNKKLQAYLKSSFNDRWLQSRNDVVQAANSCGVVLVTTGFVPLARTVITERVGLYR